MTQTADAMTPSQESYEICDGTRLTQTPLVSVLMITYNHEPFIAQAIEGVLMQETEFPIELIIGEDCSTDRTREIVLEYQRKRPDIIRVITSHKNVGARQNSARTIKACRGAYMAFCEGDDYWTEPVKLQKQVDLLESHPDATMVAHRAYRVSVDGVVQRVYPKEQPSILREYEVILRGAGFFASNSMLIRAALLREGPAWFYEFPVGDLALVLLAVLRGKIVFLNDVMSSYRMGVPGSWTARNSKTRSALLHLVSVKRAVRHMMTEEKKSLWVCRMMLIEIDFLMLKLCIHWMARKTLPGAFWRWRHSLRYRANAR